MDVEEQIARSFTILSPQQITLVLGMYKYLLAVFLELHLSETRQTKYTDK